MIAAQALGRADPDWLPAQLANPGGGGRVPGAGPPVLPPQLVVEVEAYPNPAPRTCVWVGLLVGPLLMLRMQQDRYADVVRWRSGGKTVSKVFPWEQRALVAGDEPFEATLFTPARPGASTFRRPALGADVITAGTGSVSRLGLRKGGTSAAGSGGSAGVPDDVTAMLAGGSSGAAAGGGCRGANASGSCYVAVQRVRRFENGSSCSRFVAGASLGTMQPLAGVGGEDAASLVCVDGTGIHSALSTQQVAVVDLAEVAVAWEQTQQASSRRGLHSCLAMVDFPPKAWGARPGEVDSSNATARKSRPVRTVLHDSTVLYDHASRSIVTVGFDRCESDIRIRASTKLRVDQFDAQTLALRWTYHSLPLQVAWLLRSPKRSDGYLLFAVAETQEVGAGTVFVIDLVDHEVYERGPAGPGGRRPLFHLTHPTSAARYVTRYVAGEDLPCGLSDGSCLLWRPEA